MKKFILFLIALFLYVNAFSVILDTKGTPSDQIIQGPCYAFATYAALESIAIEQGLFNSTNIDFYEWMVWSSQVLFGESDYIAAILEYASSNGVYNAYGDPNSFMPSAPRDLPNVTYQPTYGIAYFPDCGTSVENKFYMANTQDPAQCHDFYGKEFLFEDPSGDFIKLVSNGQPLYEKVASPRDFQIKSKLDQGKGVIAVFTDWNGSGIAEHAVFIYGYSGTSDYYVMDSWPGNPYKGLKTLDISKCLSMYTINWEFENNQPDPCIGEITGAFYIRDKDQATYTIDRTGNSWSVTGNLSIVSSSDNSVTVKRLSCSGSTGVVYANKSGCTAKSKTVNVYTTPYQPTVNPSGYPTISLAPGSILTLRASNGSTGGYFWTITGSLDVLNYVGPTNHICVVEAVDLGIGNFYVKTANECGYSANAGGTVNVTTGGGGGIQLIKGESSDNETNTDDVNYDMLGGDLIKLVPNPVSSDARLLYSVEEAGNVVIRIYDMSGRLVKNLVSEKKEAGVYELLFTSNDLLDGVYIVKAVISEKEATQKIIVNK